MPSFADARQFLPHSGHMALLDRIADYGEDWLIAEADLRADCIFAAEGKLPAWAAVEVMAQGIAALGGLRCYLRGVEPPVGFLLGTRKFTACAEALPLPCHAVITARESMLDSNGFGVYAVDMQVGGEVWAQANINVFSPPDIEQFMQEYQQ